MNNSIMKRITLYTIVVLSGLLSSVSCDILEQTPTDRYTDAQLWNDEFLLENHLAQLYAMCPVMISDADCVYSPDGSPLNAYYGNADFPYKLGHSAQVEAPVHATTWADEARYSGRGAQINYVGMKLYGIQANSGYLRWWENAYYLNRQLNHFIENIASSPLSNADLRSAEARFLRAFNYFALTKRYGGVPLIKKETAINAPDEELYPKRNTEKECWDYVISECLEIAGILEDKPEAGRASKWAALALASRAALYAGSVARYGTVQLDGILGVPASEADYYFDISAKAANRIMTESSHDLYEVNPDKVQNLKDIFLVKDNCEAIMVKRHGGVAGEQSTSRWSWDICCAPKPNAWGVGEYSLPYFDFVEKFDRIDGTSGYTDRELLTGKAWTMEELFGDRDPRVSAWFWTNGTTWEGAVGTPYLNGNEVTDTEDQISLYEGLKLSDGTIFYNSEKPAYKEDENSPGVMCYGDQKAGLLGSTTPHTGFGVMKYLDPEADNGVWFIYSTSDYQIFRFAEVLLNYAEAQYELGETGEAEIAINRIRSRAGVKEISGVTLDDIRHERMTELCFENHRYWDLRRWRTAETELSKTHEGLRFILDYESCKTQTPKFWLEIYEKIDGAETDPIFPSNNYYLPIGDGTISANTNLVPNPGY